MKKIVILFSTVFCISLLACTAQTEVKQEDPALKKSRVKVKVQKTEGEWKKELSPEEFEVLRKAGTERAFTGKYWVRTANKVKKKSKLVA